MYRIEHFLWKLKKSNSAFNSELVITTPTKKILYAGSTELGFSTL